MRLQFRPLVDASLIPWGGRYSQFKASWGSTMDMLERELAHLEAKNPVLAVDVAESAIRMDGSLRENFTPKSPPIRLSFDSKHGALQFTCFTYQVSPPQGPLGPAWRHNVRAIAMSLEALRAVDRHGAIQGGQQYVGLRQLEAGIGIGASHMTLEQAEHIVWETAGSPPHLNPASWRVLVKQAKVRAHPDKHEGRHGAWNRLSDALLLLERK